MGRGRGGRGRRGRPPAAQADGWEQWGGYMAAKKAKLDQQFNVSKTVENSPSTSSGSGATTSATATDKLPQIFLGVSVYINGYTNPPEPELRSIFTAHGGTYTSYLSTKTSFVIASNLPLGKKQLLATKTLTADWIVDSAKAGRKLDHRNYMLYNLNAENKQGTLSQLFVKPNSEMSTELPESKSVTKEVKEKNTTSASAENSPAASDDHLSQQNCSNLEESSEKSQDPANTNILVSNPGPAVSEVSPKNPETSPGKSKSFGKLKTAGEDGFLEDFYNNSRLHLISTMKKEVQLMVAEWRRNAATHKFPFAEAYGESLPLAGDSQAEEITGRVVFHVDLDCFFVAVGRLSRPHLQNKPIAVTHAKGTSKSGQDSRSDVSCASYEARAKGVKAGMWLHQAQKLCPEIEAIPYEFDEYKRVSKIFFETVAGFTLEMEPISIDEMVLDVTELLRTTASNPNTLAAFLRKTIKEEAKIDASIGIGSNKLTAKLATRVAKDKHSGHYYMKDAEMREHIRTQPVKSLPGVGWATADRLSTQFNVETGGQLESLTLEELKRTFGAKTGEKLYSICRGIDNDTVQCEAVNAKSLSAGCSWGVRFTKYQEVDKFIRDLANEIAQRALKSQCYGSKLSLSLWIVKKGYLNVAIKPGGHGVVDISTRTRKFLHHTRQAQIIASSALELARSITKTSITAEYIRGVSIALDGLKYENEMSDKEKRTVQTTLFPTAAKTKSSDTITDANSASNSNTPSTSMNQPKPSTSINVNEPIQSELDTSENEMDIFTGEAILPTQAQEVQEDECSERNRSEESSSSSSSDLAKSSTSDMVTTAAKTTSPISKQKKPRGSFTRVESPVPSTSIRRIQTEARARTTPDTPADNVLDEYDPVVQQRIWDSFKKPIRLPFLNQVSEIPKVQDVIRQGTKCRAPTPADIKILESYFRDLSSRPHPFLKQSCDMIKFLKSMQDQELLGLDGENRVTWTSVFEKIITDMQTSLEKTFGGRLDLNT